VPRRSRDVDDKQSEGCTKPRFAHACDETGIEGLATSHDVEEKRPDCQVRERERDEGEQIVQELQSADASSRDLEREAGAAGGEHARARFEEDATNTRAAENPAGKDSGCRYQGAGPWSQNDHCRDLQDGTQRELLGANRLTATVILRVSAQLDENPSRAEERDGGQRLIEGARDRHGKHGDAADDGQRDVASKPHRACIGFVLGAA